MQDYDLPRVGKRPPKDPGGAEGPAAGSGAVAGAPTGPARAMAPVSPSLEGTCEQPCFINLQRLQVRRVGTVRHATLARAQRSQGGTSYKRVWESEKRNEDTGETYPGSHGGARFTLTGSRLTFSHRRHILGRHGISPAPTALKAVRLRYLLWGTRPIGRTDSGGP
jgi:hypothetical protein